MREHPENEDGSVPHRKSDADAAPIANDLQTCDCAFPHGASFGEYVQIFDEGYDPPHKVTSNSIARDRGDVDIELVEFGLRSGSR